MSPACSMCEGTGTCHLLVGAAPGRHNGEVTELVGRGYGYRRSLS